MHKVVADPAPFPVRSKTGEKFINNISTIASGISFADKIVLTICQNGRLAHWVQIPLSNPHPDQVPPASFETDLDAPQSDLLPAPHLTTSTLLGGTAPERETAGQLVATQIGSLLLKQRPEEQRTLVVGIGFQNAQLSSDEFAELVDLGLSML
ncbi:hypothetical protein BT63DRAFT_411267 [Microthyrium microscopicum]|uniref:Proteasome assembly chaperone 3 n=1 Tax=Microthyrium microscopicum TaxID=703497 RepID=A0A6A6UKF7_9PEZI|nr:hypothetical protein BT63DRAFT_411267 [Microthyrium microscopicum]